MGRAVTGRRHGITYEYLREGGYTYVAARCVCGKLTSPHRFSMQQAEEDARDHTWRTEK